MSPELDRIIRDREVAAARVATARMDQAWRDLFRPVAYTRPGYGPGMLLTDEQWQLLDSVEKHAAAREARYGRLFPKAFEAMRNTSGRFFCRG